MKPESGIKNRWTLLEKAIGIVGIERKFDAYSWYNDSDLRISKSEHWCGFWNDCFDFVFVTVRENQLYGVLEALKSNPAAVAAITFLGLMIMCILISGIVLIIAEFARRSSREKLRLRKGIFNISTGKKALVYFTAPATIVLLLYLIFMTAMSTLSYSAM